jgi:hypothetical protein
MPLDNKHYFCLSSLYITKQQKKCINDGKVKKTTVPIVLLWPPVRVGGLGLETFS